MFSDTAKHNTVFPAFGGTLRPSHEAPAMFTELFRSWTRKGPKAHQPRIVACSDNPCVRRKAAYVYVDDSASDESNVDATMGKILPKNAGATPTRAKKNFNPQTSPQTVSLQNGESMSTGPYDSRGRFMCRCSEIHGVQACYAPMFFRWQCIALLLFTGGQRSGSEMFEESYSIF